ncbi:MAG: nucleotidyltransferase domain-containing protein [Verrucomicrobiales bacterium]
MTTTQTNRGEILDQLRALERQHGFRVLYACESGSRAWGFASDDSDYDVRFIYVHRPEWYLSVRSRPDSVTFFASDMLDLAGWDLRKALGLFGRSNGALLEWLHSPIRYVEHPDLMPLWRALVPDVLNPRALAAHYLGMAWKLWLVARDGEAVSTKKYLYILRTVLAARWVISRKSPPPVAFARLLEEALNEDDLRGRCRALVAAKAAAQESSAGARDHVLDQWLTAQFQALRILNADLPNLSADHEVIDTFFRHALEDVWSGI